MDLRIPHRVRDTRVEERLSAVVRPREVRVDVVVVRVVPPVEVRDVDLALRGDRHPRLELVGRALRVVLVHAYRIAVAHPAVGRLEHDHVRARRDRRVRRRAGARRRAAVALVLVVEALTGLRDQLAQVLLVQLSLLKQVLGGTRGRAHHRRPISVLGVDGHVDVALRVDAGRRDRQVAERLPREGGVLPRDRRDRPRRREAVAEVGRLHLHQRVELVVVPGHVDRTGLVDDDVAADPRYRALLAQRDRRVVAGRDAAPRVPAVGRPHEDDRLTDRRHHGDRAPLVEPPAGVERADLAVARLVRAAVRGVVVVDRDPVLVIQEQGLLGRVRGVRVDGDRLAPALGAVVLDVQAHAPAARVRRAAGRVEDERVGVALVVHRHRDVGGDVVLGQLLRVALRLCRAVTRQLVPVLPVLPAVERLVRTDLEEVMRQVVVHLRPGDQVLVVERVHRDRRL